MNLTIIKILIFSLFVFLLSVEIKAAVILQYHHISNDTPQSTSTSPKLFKQHIQYLIDNQFNVVSLDTFIEHLKKQIPFKDKTVLITFDDGYQSIFDNALPILKQADFPFTVFVNAKPIEQKLSQWMSWQTLKALQKEKGSIANHSYQHKHLIRRSENEQEADWSKRILTDLLKNQNLLEKKLQISNRVLAYPYGEYNQGLKQLLKKNNFLGFAQHSGAVSINVDQQAIPRFAFGGNYGAMDDFIIKVNALPFKDKKLELINDNNQLINEHVFDNGSFLKPKLKIVLKDKTLLNKINCYFSGQGKLEKVLHENSAVFTLKNAIKSGRSRFNCTAPSNQKGRFYWVSQPIIKALDNGSWYNE